MKILPIEVLGDEPNAVVIRTPGRRFPGIVIQGDSLRILCDSVEEVREHVAACEQTEEAKEELEAVLISLEDKLRGYLQAYERALAENGIELPYSRNKG